MATSPVPDPYLALGVAKDADQAHIKAVYRKAALKFHPDKVTDESKKAEASDNFHKIQQAYEILSDEDRRAKYDASARLAALRQEVLQRQQSQHAPSPLRTDFRQHYFEQPPPGARTPTFSPRYERHERPRSYDNDDYPEPPQSARPASRKTSYTEKEHRKYPKSDTERKSHAKSAEKSSHHDRKKYSEKDRKKDRESKSQRLYVQDHSDESDDDLSRPRTRPHDSPRERERARGTRDRDRDRDRDSYSRRLSLSDSDSEGGALGKLRSNSNSARDYISRSQGHAKLDERSSRRPSLPLRHSTLDDLQDYDGVRRSSVSNDGRTKHYFSERPERVRQYSAPIPDFKNDVFTRPKLEKSHTSPVEVFDADKKSKSKTTFYQIPGVGGLRREHSDSHTSTRRRPRMGRESSKLNQQVEYENGVPAPDSPPRDQKTKYRYSDEDKYEGDMSPRDSERRRRTDSPPGLDRKSRSHSSRHIPGSPTMAPPKLTIPKAEPMFAAQFSSEPQSARSSPRVSPTRAGDTTPLFGEVLEVKSASRAKGSSRSRDYDEPESPYIVREFEPTKMPPKMRSGLGSRRSSNRPTPSRGHSYTGKV